MKRRLHVTELYRRCTCGSRSTAVSVQESEKNYRDKDVQLGGELDLLLMPKDAFNYHMTDMQNHHCMCNSICMTSVTAMHALCLVNCTLRFAAN